MARAAEWRGLPNGEGCAWAAPVAAALGVVVVALALTIAAPAELALVVDGGSVGACASSPMRLLCTCEAGAPGQL